MAETSRGRERECNDTCGCDVPCLGGSACRWATSVEVTHALCACGVHCTCADCTCGTSCTCTVGRM